ncbi:hypothetical protein A1OE_1373 [Candidatus Endolissoclinum faulkneri L2]|uniref:Uncharacterized protein n=1 Tax=Candidatus Endolissoclinum faulkneri L2 TaxID=1193729 RepID=K7YSM9_9PROT|nr:hypothetical protein A1OE_1373 [Candidatus Endolissoclinum faulkneri L2]
MHANNLSILLIFFVKLLLSKLHNLCVLVNYWNCVFGQL